MSSRHRSRSRERSLLAQMAEKRQRSRKQRLERKSVQDRRKCAVLVAREKYIEAKQEYIDVLESRSKFGGINSFKELIALKHGVKMSYTGTQISFNVQGDHVSVSYILTWMKRFRPKYKSKQESGRIVFQKHVSQDGQDEGKEDGNTGISL